MISSKWVWASVFCGLIGTSAACGGTDDSVGTSTENVEAKDASPQGTKDRQRAFALAQARYEIGPNRQIPVPETTPQRIVDFMNMKENPPPTWGQRVLVYKVPEFGVFWMVAVQTAPGALPNHYFFDENGWLIMRQDHRPVACEWDASFHCERFVYFSEDTWKTLLYRNPNALSFY